MTAPARFLIHHHPATDTRSEGYYLWDGPKFVRDFADESDAKNYATQHANDGDKLNFSKGGVMHGIEIAKPTVEADDGK